MVTAIGLPISRGLATLLRVSESRRPVPAERDRTPRWGLARVRGDSMRPALVPGDRVLVDYRRVPQPGDIVVARLPGRPVSVKRAAERRVTDLGEPGWWLLSDNGEAGTDSRQLGAIPECDVIGVVRLKIWPPRSRRIVRNSPRV